MHIHIYRPYFSFPYPLSVDEEQKYLELFHQGDEEARNILIERNLRLVAHIAKKYNTANIDCDDMISIGTIGLIQLDLSLQTDTHNCSDKIHCSHFQQI